MSSAIYPSLAKRAVFITGGASGIGAALVSAFCRQKASVGFIDIDERSAARLIKDVQGQAGGGVWFRPVDVRDVSALQNSTDEFADDSNRLSSDRQVDSRAVIQIRPGVNCRNRPSFEPSASGKRIMTMTKNTSGFNSSALLRKASLRSRSAITLNMARCSDIAPAQVDLLQGIAVDRHVLMSGKDGHAAVLAMGDDQRLYDFFAGLIERVEGFVEQPQFGRRHEYPAERETPLLPGREPPRHDILQAGQAQPFQDGAAIGVFPGTGKALHEQQVFPGG